MDTMKIKIYSFVVIPQKIQKIKHLNVREPTIEHDRLFLQTGKL